VLGAVALSAAVVAPGRARADCSSVQITTEPAVLAGEWQTAVLDLAQQTRRTGMPWSCVGGALLVRAEAGERVFLRFRDEDGHEVERHVPSPRSLVATAEALLATAGPGPSPSTKSREKLSQSAVDDAELARERPPPDRDEARLLGARQRGEPRYLFDATVGIRFSGPSAALWLAPELCATVPFEAWSVGVWVRYGVPYVFDRVPKDFSMSQVNLGLSAGYQLLSAPVDLRVSLNPSVSVVSMDGDLTNHEGSGAKVDLYVGAGLSAAIPFTPTWRGVVVVDAEMVPAAIRAERRIDPALPPFPAYEIGAAFGVELVAR
jgi:hypothetical protein